MAAGTIFRLGEQKLNDFLVGRAKIGEIQSRQSNSKYNFMQYAFFRKKVTQCCTMGSGASCWEIYENFCVKLSNLTVCKVRHTFNCKLQKKHG